MAFNTTGTYKRLTKYLDLKANYTPPEYGEVDDVSAMLHSFYHYDTDVADVSDQGYQKSILGFFLATVVIGLFAICIVCSLNCCVMFRSFRTTCKILFKCNGKVGRIMVLSLFFLTALIFTCSLIGYFDLVAACDGLAVLLEQLSNDFYTLEKNAAELHKQRGRQDSIVKLQARYFGYRSYIYTANCSVLDEAGMQTFYESAESLTFSVEGMGDSMNDFAEMVGSLTNFISMGQFGLVLAYWLLTGLGVFATKSKNCSCDDTLLLFSSSIILLCFIVYLGCMVAVSVAAGDFCYGPDGDGPDASMTSAAENSLKGSQLSLTKHYMTCEGGNPLIELMSNMTTALVSLGNAAYSGRAANECDEDGIEPINGEITTTLEYFDEMIDIISCSTINAKIQKAVYVYVCDDLINGLWSTWALQSAASFLLWLSLVIFPFATNQKADVLDISFGHVIWEDIEDETEKAEREALEAAEKKRLDDAMRERQLAEAKRLKEKYEAEKAAAFDDVDDIGEFAL